VGRELAVFRRILLASNEIALEKSRLREATSRYFHPSPAQLDPEFCNLGMDLMEIDKKITQPAPNIEHPRDGGSSELEIG
jgi:hypothetical protein